MSFVPGSGQALTQASNKQSIIVGYEYATSV
jgi:hypothetical protein